MTEGVSGAAAPSPEAPGYRRLPGFRLMIVSAVLGGCAVAAGVVAALASANGDIAPPAPPGAVSPAGLPQQSPGPGVPTGMPSVPGAPSELPSIPQFPTSLPSMPAMPAGFPPVPGAQGSVPNGGQS